MRGTHGFAFVLDDELCEDDLVAVVVTTPSGQVVRFWAEVEFSGTAIVLRQLAIYGLNVTRGVLGWTLLR